MILLCGIPSDAPLENVSSALQQIKVPCFVLNQRNVAQTQIEFAINKGRASGWLECGNEIYQLEDFDGIYVRFMDDRYLPEVLSEPQDSPLRSHSRSVHGTLMAWLEVTESRVVNRPSAMASNNSKPFQAQLIQAHGLRTPETLITNDPELVREFWRCHRRVIYKSISGTRSIVQMLQKEDLERIDKIRWCPTQFQEFVDGENVRVHVIGSRVFATRIRSAAVDYRYAQSQVGALADLEAFDLPLETQDRCVAVAAALGLPFAGIDLKISSNGDVCCFEANPCPGFSYYESNTGQPIAMAVAEYLSGRLATEDSSSAVVRASVEG